MKLAEEFVDAIPAIVLILSAIGGAIAWLWNRRRSKVEYALLPVEAYDKLVNQLQAELMRQAGKIAAMDTRLQKVEEERDDLEERVELLTDQLHQERDLREDCGKKIQKLEEVLEEFKRQNDAWMQWYMIVLKQFMQLEITPPPDAPAGPMLPRDDG